MAKTRSASISNIFWGDEREFVGRSVPATTIGIS
jgi:hypothetical protein